MEEIARLSQALGEPARTIFVLGVLTGLRIGEILALKLDDVDFSTNLLHVRRNIYRGEVQDSPKTEESARRVPLALVAVSAVKRWLVLRPSGSDWLFPNSAGRAFHDDRNLMRRGIKPVCRKIGIAPFGWHSLRHTFSTYNGNSGVPIPVLQSLLGHRDAAPTMIYTHPLEDAQRGAVEQLASVLFRFVPKLQTEQEQGGSLIQ